MRERSRKGDREETDVIVEFNNDADAEAVVKQFGQLGRKLGLLKSHGLRLPNAVILALAGEPRVKRISHDRAVTGDVARTAVTIGSRAVVDLMGYTGAGVGVAVIDSGIATFHDDMRPKGFGALLGNDGQRVRHFKDFVGGHLTAYDDWGHGTHVGGIIAGNGYDSKGLREAIAPGAHLVVLKALDGNGSGRISDIIAAIEYAIAVKTTYNIRVINMSLGAGVFESYNTDPLTLAAKKAVDAGIVVVASAGNMGKATNGAPQYGAIGAPGNAPWVLTVGASSTMGDADRRNDTMASYSSRGPTMVDFAAKPDLVAPGSGTVSLGAPGSKLYTDKPLNQVDGTVTGLLSKPYLTMSGTSMSAPVVAGTVALMLHANPNLTPNMVKAILQYTAQVYPSYDFLTQGAGFLNARGAVVLAEFFKNGRPGSPYPRMKGWSKHIFWGNSRVRGGVLTPNGTAWANNIVWGDSRTSGGQNIVWGDNCDTADCSNIVWGNNIVWGDTALNNIVWGTTDGDNIVWGNSSVGNIVWGNSTVTNIVWGNNDGDNIVWGNDCAGANCDNIIWGQVGVDNIVWGNAEGIENIVWGNALDNVVWGNSAVQNISWGNSAADVTFGDDTAQVQSFDSALWDSLFEAAVPDPPLVGTSTVTTTSTTSLIGGIF